MKYCYNITSVTNSEINYSYELFLLMINSQTMSLKPFETLSCIITELRELIYMLKKQT